MEETGRNTNGESEGYTRPTSNAAETGSSPTHSPIPSIKTNKARSTSGAGVGQWMGAAIAIIIAAVVTAVLVGNLSSIQRIQRRSISERSTGPHVVTTGNVRATTESESRPNGTAQIVETDDPCTQERVITALLDEFCDTACRDARQSLIGAWHSAEVEELTDEEIKTRIENSSLIKQLIGAGSKKETVETMAEALTLATTSTRDLRSIDSAENVGFNKYLNQYVCNAEVSINQEALVAYYTSAIILRFMPDLISEDRGEFRSLTVSPVPKSLLNAGGLRNAIAVLKGKASSLARADLVCTKSHIAVRFTVSLAAGLPEVHFVEPPQFADQSCLTRNLQASFQ